MMHSLIDLKSAFVTNALEFKYYPQMRGKNHPLFVDFRSSNKGVLEQKKLNQLRTFINGNLDEKWFVLNLINVLDHLPINVLEPLLEILMPYSFDLPMSDSVLGNLDRIFGFINTEAAIQNLYIKYNLPVTKAMVTGMFHAHKIDDGFEYNDNAILIYSRIDYEWKIDKFKPIHKTDDLEDYQTSINEIMNKRYELILQAFTMPGQTYELMRVLRGVFPSNSARPKHLTELYNKALLLAKEITDKNM